VKKYVLVVQGINLSTDGRMTERVTDSLIMNRAKDPSAPTPEEIDKISKIINSLNSQELNSIYQERIERLLEAVKNDRERLELAASQGAKQGNRYHS
jgi:hypothetical protein